jgi:hypothetical protein
MEQLGCHWTDFHESWYLCSIQKSVEKIQVSLQSKKMKCAWREDQCTFMTYLVQFFLEWKNFSDRSYTENQNARFTFSIFFFENCAVYEIIWKNAVEPRMPQMKIRRVLFACQITKARIRNTFKIFHIYCFSTTTVVTGTRLSVTLYLFWLPC